MSSSSVPQKIVKILQDTWYPILAHLLLILIKKKISSVFNNMLNFCYWSFHTAVFFHWRELPTLASGETPLHVGWWGRGTGWGYIKTVDSLNMGASPWTLYQIPCVEQVFASFYYFIIIIIFINKALSFIFMNIDKLTMMI